MFPVPKTLRPPWAALKLGVYKGMSIFSKGGAVLGVSYEAEFGGVSRQQRGETSIEKNSKYFFPFSGI